MSYFVKAARILPVPDHHTDPHQPLWAEALQAFLDDPAYVIEMAKVGSAIRERQQSRQELPELSGV